MTPALLLFSLAVAAPQSDDLKRDMKALEIFLQDKADKKDNCVIMSNGGFDGLHSKLVSRLKS